MIACSSFRCMIVFLSASSTCEHFLHNTSRQTVGTTEL